MKISYSHCTHTTAFKIMIKKKCRQPKTIKWDTDGNSIVSVLRQEEIYLHKPLIEGLI